MTMQRNLKVYFDGGCRPNPGPIEAAVVLRGAVHVHDDLLGVLHAGGAVDHLRGFQLRRVR